MYEIIRVRKHTDDQRPVGLFRYKPDAERHIKTVLETISCHYKYLVRRF